MQAFDVRGGRVYVHSDRFSTDDDRHAAFEWPDGDVTYVSFHGDFAVPMLSVGKKVLTYREFAQALAELKLPKRPIVLVDCLAGSRVMGSVELANQVRAATGLGVLATTGNVWQLRLTPAERAAGMKVVMTSEFKRNDDGPVLVRPTADTVGPDWLWYSPDGSEPQSMGPDLETALARVASARDAQLLSRMHVAKSVAWLGGVTPLADQRIRSGDRTGAVRRRTG